MLSFVVLDQYFSFEMTVKDWIRELANLTNVFLKNNLLIKEIKIRR